MCQGPLRYVTAAASHSLIPWKVQFSALAPSSPQCLRDALRLHYLCACPFPSRSLGYRLSHPSCHVPEVALQTPWTWPLVCLAVKKDGEPRKIYKQIHRWSSLEAKNQNYSNTTWKLGVAKPIFWLLTLLPKSKQQRRDNRWFLILFKKEYGRRFSVGPTR